MHGGSYHKLADRVRLRDVTIDDLPDLFRFQSDLDAVQMAVVSPRPEDAFVAFWESVLADPSVVAKVIVVDEAVIGNISCFEMDGQDSVGYWVDRAFWGRGVATAALTLLLEQVPTRPLHARVARSNLGSIRVLERCGFACLGTQWFDGDDRFPACEEALFRIG
ncbi:MAG: GNAT family N-acetyltransferase [Phycisphaerales bacterium]